jgi:hypothetical protein
VANFIRMTDLDLKGKRVFIRADLNVPTDDNGEITDETRITASLESMRTALAAGAAVMVTSHFGRPKEGNLKPEDSLIKVAERIAVHLGRPVPLAKNWLESGLAVAPGEIVLLENCRGNVGEKANDEALSKRMAAPAMSMSTTLSALPTGPRRPRTASPASRRSPVPGRYLPPSSMRLVVPSASRNARCSPSSAAPRCPRSSPSCVRLPSGSIA